VPRSFTDGLDRADVLRFQDRLREALGHCTCLQEAAQCTTDYLWDFMQNSAVLVRCFATLHYERLPTHDQAFVQHMIERAAPSISSHGSSHSPLAADTLVLSLLGTRGLLPAWNDRSQSKGHLGIPLLSADFIAGIPMLARLLTELGVETDATDHRFVELRLAAGEIGVFFVPDAAHEMDSLGRPVISDQAFVQSHGVKTVFGFGAACPDGTILTLLVFTREKLPKETILALTHLPVLIKAAVSDLLRRQALFPVAE
jgi:hypothetical protein